MSEPRAERTRTLLHEADDRLRQAQAHLAGAPPDYAAALTDVLAVFRTSLRAYLAWNGSADVREDADFRTLVNRAGHLASILKTPAHRALLLAERAPFGTVDTRTADTRTADGVPETAASWRRRVDASARLPVLAYVVSGVFWLLVGTAFALLASFKLHTPARGTRRAPRIWRGSSGSVRSAVSKLEGMQIAFGRSRNGTPSRGCTYGAARGVRRRGGPGTAPWDSSTAGRRPRA